MDLSLYNNQLLLFALIPIFIVQIISVKVWLNCQKLFYKYLLVFIPFLWSHAHSFTACLGLRASVWEGSIANCVFLRSFTEHSIIGMGAFFCWKDHYVYSWLLFFFLSPFPLLIQCQFRGSCRLELRQQY